MKTFFVNENSIINNTVTLKDEEHNHAKNVLRLNVGIQVKVVCGNDFNYFCTISQINKNSTTLTVDYKELNTANPKTQLTAFVALIKNDNLHLIIQKLTELGVSEVVPFESRFTVVKDKKNKSEKLQQISQQSIKQCGRSKPLIINPTINIKNMCFKNFDAVIFANESENNVSLKKVLSTNHKKVAIIIGPEGGFTNEEKEFIVKNGAKSISLGKRILRAETAAIMLATLVLNYLGEYD